MFNIDDKIILIFLTFILFVIISFFEPVLSHINLLEKELFKEENPENIKIVKKFLSNILKYKILIYILQVFVYSQIFKYVYYFLGFRIRTILFIFVIILFNLIIKVFSKKNIYITFIKNFYYIHTIYILIYPIIAIFYFIYNKLNQIFNNGNEIERVKLTEEDIKNIINSENTKDVELEEKEMIHSIFSFTDTNVREIMTPRISIVAFDKDLKLEDVWDEIIECEFSRLPIYSENIDDIIGIVNTKDLMKYIKNGDKSLTLEYFIKSVSYIPETKSLIQMLEHFRKNQQHMAIIIDEYGGTLGLITIEDLLEEIVGEIRDEYDIEDENFKKISSNIFEVLGETLVEDINLEYDLDIKVSEEYDTIAGYIQYSLGRVAKINDKVINDKLIIQVLEVDNKKIEKVKLIIK